MKTPQENEGLRSARIMHTMLRVGDLERSIEFYVGTLGMKLFRREDYPDGRFTLAFLGYGDERTSAVIELTHNWDRAAYEAGTAYGHVALEVQDIEAVCDLLAAKGAKLLRQPGPMTHASPQRTWKEIIAFFEDPDGYRIELIQKPN